MTEQLTTTSTPPNTQTEFESHLPDQKVGKALVNQATKRPTIPSISPAKLNVLPSSPRLLGIKIGKYSLLTVSVGIIGTLAVLIPLGLLASPILISALLVTSTIGIVGFFMLNRVQENKVQWAQNVEIRKLQQAKNTEISKLKKEQKAQLDMLKKNRDEKLNIIYDLQKPLEPILGRTLVSPALAEFQEFFNSPDVKADVDKQVIEDVEKHPENYQVFDVKPIIQAETDKQIKEQALWNLEQLFLPKDKRVKWLDSTGKDKTDETKWENILKEEQYTSIDKIQTADWIGTQFGKDFNRYSISNFAIQDEKGNVTFLRETRSETLYDKTGNKVDTSDWNKVLIDVLKEVYPNPEDSEKQIKAFLSIFNTPKEAQSIFTNGTLTIAKSLKSDEDQALLSRSRCPITAVFQYDGSVILTAGKAQKDGANTSAANADGDSTFFTENFFPILGITKVKMDFKQGNMTEGNAEWKISKYIIPISSVRENLAQNTPSVKIPAPRFENNQ